MEFLYCDDVETLRYNHTSSEILKETIAFATQHQLVVWGCGPQHHKNLDQESLVNKVRVKCSFYTSSKFDKHVRENKE